MNLPEILLLAVGLSMDAFAVAICVGLKIRKFTINKALIAGLYFGLFQAGMPIIGYLLAIQLTDIVADFSPWIAFALLSFIGGKMLADGLKKDENCCEVISSQDEHAAVSFGVMLPLAVATSIDAMAVGVSLAFLHVNIMLAAVLIGLTTLIISVAGVKIGNMFGSRYKSKAEILGGVILIGIGLHILLENFLR